MTVKSSSSRSIHPDAAPGLSVVVPVRDEVGSIEPLLREIHAALSQRITFEVIYVDDGSCDGTWEALGAARAWMPELRLVRHTRSIGQSGAIVSGVLAARAEWIATLDGDGQNDPADLPELLEARDGYVGAGDLMMVAGRREQRRDSWSKRVSSRLANGVRRRLLRDDTPDTGCGLKLFRRDAFLRLPRFDHMHRFLPALVQRDGGAVVTVAVSHRPRLNDRSKYGVHNRLWVGLVDLAGVWWLQRRRLPVESVTVRDDDEVRAEANRAEPGAASDAADTRDESTSMVSR